MPAPGKYPDELGETSVRLVADYRRGDPSCRRPRRASSVKVVAWRLCAFVNLADVT